MGFKMSAELFTVMRISLCTTLSRRLLTNYKEKSTESQRESDEDENPSRETRGKNEQEDSINATPPIY